MTPSCVRCGTPTADGYACHRCAVVRAGEQLTQICDMAQAARDVAHRLTSTQGGGGASGVPGPTLPLDLSALERLSAVERELTKWVDHIGTERGTTRPWFTTHGDKITTAAQWLTPHLEWARHQPDREPDDRGNTWGAEQFLRDVEACARLMAGVARGPRDQKYLGPCGAPLIAIEPDVAAEHGIHPANAALGLAPCEGDVYGPAGGNNGTCRTCGAQVDQAERRAWLDDQVRDKAFRAAHIADAYGINVKTIRSWADRGHLLEHGRDRDGKPLYLVGEVLDLAAEAAARRAENQAKRARKEVAA